MDLPVQCRAATPAIYLRRIKFFTRPVGVDFAEPLAGLPRRGIEAAAARVATKGGT
jgi:hypothetical protein